MGARAPGQLLPGRQQLTRALPQLYQVGLYLLLQPPARQMLVQVRSPAAPPRRLVLVPVLEGGAAPCGAPAGINLRRVGEKAATERHAGLSPSVGLATMLSKSCCSWGVLLPNSILTHDALGNSCRKIPRT